MTVGFNSEPEKGCWRSGVLEDLNFYLVNARTKGDSVRIRVLS